MTTLLSATIKLREARAARRFELAMADPVQAQTQVLESLLARNADTVFGCDHRLRRVTGPNDYARAVPIRDYEGHRPYIQRAIAGEEGVLTADRLTMLTMTSGTTAEPKLIPVTASWCAQMAGLTRLWMFHALAQHPRCFDGKVLMLSSPAVEGTTAAGLPFGSMSGVAYRRIPRIVRDHYAAPYAVALIKNHEDRYFTTMRLALAHDVTAVATPNPSSLLRLAGAVAGREEDTIRAIHDGRLGLSELEFIRGADMSPSDARHEIRAALVPDPSRARALTAVLREHGALHPRYCWPNIAFIGCWLGGSAGIHAEHLSTTFGSATPRRDLGLIASEGRITVPLHDATAAGPLAVHANYYEFIPEDRIDDTDPPIVLAHQLELSKRYYVILTGGNGLYRYDINDIIEVHGFHGRTPKVAFVRKGRDMISIVGEKLHLNQIQTALQRAQAASDTQIWQFRLIPDVDLSVYDLLVEPLEVPPHVNHFDRLIAIFDSELAILNNEYAAKRASGRLHRPRLHVMRRGWSEHLCRRDFDGGKREVQHKWTVLADHWAEGERELREPAVDCYSIPCSSA